MDMRNGLPADNSEFLVRGFPCEAANESLAYDKTGNFYSPLNDIYRYAMYTHDMFMETIGRSPLGKTTSDIIRGKH